MAIQDKTLTSVEHDWFATKSGQPSNAPLSQHKRAYIEKVLGFTFPAGTPISEMEKRWLLHSGAKPSNNLSDLWHSVAGVAPNGAIDGTKKSMNQIKFEFYVQNQEF
jgi:hypothetical protein